MKGLKPNFSSLKEVNTQLGALWLNIIWLKLNWIGDGMFSSLSIPLSLGWLIERKLKLLWFLGFTSFSMMLAFFIRLFLVGLEGHDPGSELVVPNKTIHYWSFQH